MKLSSIVPSTASSDEVAEFYRRVNDTTSDYNRDKSIVDVFREQVIARPERTAVVAYDGKMTYGELDRESDRIAGWILEQGAVAEMAIAVMLNRSANLIVTIIGILKAGCVYMPLNPSIPLWRAKYMITSAGVTILIAEKEFISQATQLQWMCPGLARFFCVDSDDVYAEGEQEGELMKSELWDYVVKKADDDISQGGWFNSFNGKKFTRAEMDEYAMNIHLKLQPYLGASKEVLEIGCSSGISMFRLAPQVKSYLGVDLSAAVIDRNRERCIAQGIDNITLECLQADKIDSLGKDRFDMVILNSVIQAFSGLNYLRKVLSKVIEVLKGEGVIFVGDIPDLELKEAFLNELKRHKQRHPEDRTRLDLSDELFVHRAFFDSLRFDYPEVAEVKVSEKIGSLRNELTDYRFDVIIKINKAGSVPTEGERCKYQFDRRSLGRVSKNYSRVAVRPDQLSNIMFTSGSTGMPKGVLIEHRAILRTVKNTNYIKTHPDDVWSQTADISFDPSCMEIFSALLNGACLAIIPRNELLDITHFRAYLASGKITILHLVAPLFHEYAETDPGMFAGIGTIIVGGAVLSPKLVSSVRRHCPGIRIVNAYGPTENTVNSTTFEVDDDYFQIPIGRPVANAGVYVVDKNELQPPGMPGELYVFGDGLARGYLGDEQLTAEKFITDPFGHAGRVYKTGDFVRMRKDGNLEFLGRKDDQIKIRGHRIEIAEVEIRMLSLPQISEAVVVVVQVGNEPALCAYVKMHIAITVPEIKELLSIELPDYMIPACFIEVDKFDRLPNGKVDRTRLPAPVDLQLETDRKYVPPGSALEQKLVGIWEEILERKGVGVTDNFYLIGGHSLKATRIIARILKELNVKVELKDFFGGPTIQELAREVQKKEQMSCLTISPVPPAAYYDAMHSEEILWFRARIRNAEAFNMQLTFEISYLVVSVLKKVFQALIAKYELLRTNFLDIEGAIKQQVREAADVRFEIEDCRMASGENEASFVRGQAAEDMARRFDLQRDQLFHVKLLRLDDVRTVLIFTIHHIISDAWSLDILEKEMFMLYQAYSNGDAVQLDIPAIQNKEYASWQKAYLKGKEGDMHKRYWQDKLKDLGSLCLSSGALFHPSRYDAGITYEQVIRDDAKRYTSLREDELGRVTGLLSAARLYPGAIYTTTIEEALLEKLKVFAGVTQTTLFNVVATAINILLHHLSGSEDIFFGNSITTRQQEETVKLIGFHVNTVVYRTRVTDTMIVSDLIKAVNDTIMEATRHQIYPFEKILSDLNVPLERIGTLFLDYTGYDNLALLPDDPADNAAPGIVAPYFDIDCFIAEFANGLKVTCAYKTDYFQQPFIHSFFEKLKLILSCIAVKANIRVGDIMI